jgi:DNA-directed RNA polymerase specialized sigma24 family protein
MPKKNFDSAEKNKLLFLPSVNGISRNDRELSCDVEAVQTDVSATACFPSGDSLESVIQSCRRRIRSWRIPPNWCRADWFEEVKALETIAAWQYGRVYDTSSGIKYETFVYQKVMAVVLTHYRREWRYALRFIPTDECASRRFSSNGVSNSDGFIERDDIMQCGSSVNNVRSSITGLRAALKNLSKVQRQLIRNLYVYGYSEAEIGKSLEISQRAVNKRKHVILKLLREQLS